MGMTVWYYAHCGNIAEDNISEDNIEGDNNTLLHIFKSRPQIEISIQLKSKFTSDITGRCIHGVME